MTIFKTNECGHITKKIPTSQIINDYHPLTKDQINELLRYGILCKNNNFKLFSILQCKLIQGIKGMVCPHPIVGIIAEKSYIIDYNFQLISHENIDKLTDLFNETMNY